MSPPYTCRPAVHFALWVLDLVDDIRVEGEDTARLDLAAAPRHETLWASVEEPVDLASGVHADDGPHPVVVHAAAGATAEHDALHRELRRRQHRVGLQWVDRGPERLIDGRSVGDRRRDHLGHRVR